MNKHHHESTYQEYEPSTDLRDIVRNFAAWTSIHGIPHIVLTEYWYLRLLWAIITLAAFGMVVFQVITLFIQYFSWPVNLETSIEFGILTFPTITFCNVNAWKRSGIAGTPLQPLVAAYESFDPSPEFGFESPPTQAKQLRATNWMWLMGEHLIELDQNNSASLSYTWQDLFISCSYNSEVCTEANFQAFYDVYFGRCFVFNSNGNLTSTGAGPKVGLRIVMKITEEEFLPWTSSVGAVIYTGLQNITSYEDAYGYFAANGQASEFGLNFVERMKLSYPFSNCTDTNEGVHQNIYYSKDYEVESCIRSCLQDRIVAVCGCYSPQFNKPINSTVVGARTSCYTVTNKNSAIDCIAKIVNVQDSSSDWNVWNNCKCPFSCDQSYYEVSLSTAKWPARMYVPPECIAENVNSSDVWDSSEQCIQFYKTSTLLMDIFFESNAKKVQLESQGYKVINFIADSGGTVGLWLGMSGVSVIEAIIFLILVAKWFIWRPAKVKIDPKFDYFATLQQPQNYDLYPMEKYFSLPPTIQQSR